MTSPGVHAVGRWLVEPTAGDTTGLHCHLESDQIRMCLMPGYRILVRNHSVLLLTGLFLHGAESFFVNHPIKVFYLIQATKE